MTQTHEDTNGVGFYFYECCRKGGNKFREQ